MTEQLQLENKKETPENNRMSFIRLLESTEVREYSEEYEVASEVRIIGQLNYHSNDLIFRFLTGEANRDGLFKYTLTISAPAAFRLPTYKASKGGYYFQGGSADEILSLTSLHLRCRFFSIASIFRNVGGPPLTKMEYDFNYIHPKKNADYVLFAEPARNFGSLGEFFDEVRRLPEALHHPFANAVRLYGLALREIGVNDELAYVHLVSAVEILSTEHVLSEEQDPLKRFIDQITDILVDAEAEAKSDLRNLFEQRKTMMKFIGFIKTHSKDVIIERPSEGALQDKVYRDNLFETLRKIYRGRSKFLHEGSVMYLSMPGLTVVGCDYDSSGGQVIDNREFKLEDKLPNVSFFENLVRGCLLDFLTFNTR